MNKTAHKQILILAIALAALLCIAAPIVWLFYGEDVEAFLCAIPKYAGLDEAGVRFRQLADNVLAATHDDLLEEPVIFEVYVPRSKFYCGCNVRGQGARIYGTDRTFEEVITEYSVELRGKGWSHSESSDPLHHFNHPNETLWVRIAPTDVGLSDRMYWLGSNDYEYVYHPEWEHYQTLYRISITYGEPKLLGCYG
jgi:hypothetical protein